MTHSTIRPDQIPQRFRLGMNPDCRKYIDHVYCIWTGNRSASPKKPDGERIFLSVSRDGGRNWDQPVAISEQPLGSDSEQDYVTAIPSVAVNTDGVVAVSWYDRGGLDVI